MPRIQIPIRGIATATIVAATLLPPAMSVAETQQNVTRRTSCRYIDPVTHRCVNFRSDSSWPEGFRRNNTGNGG